MSGLFQNSKIALTFVAVTVLGAVAMVGTSDSGGLLPRVVSFANAKGQEAIARQASEGAASQDGSEAAPAASVFGDYNPAQAALAQPAASPAVSAKAGKADSPMTAPLAPNAVVLRNE